MNINFQPLVTDASISSRIDVKVQLLLTNTLWNPIDDTLLGATRILVGSIHRNGREVLASPPICLSPERMSFP